MAPMWSLASQVVKQTFPATHRHLNRIPFCLPRRIGGHLVWVQPRLLTAEPPEKHIVKWMSESLTRDGTFFDVGAHYGWITMAAARRVGRSGRVVAFEPAPVLLDILAYHKRVNRLRQVEIIGRAVSESDRDAVPFFLLNGGLSFRNSLTIGADDVPYVKAAEKTSRQVSSITLDRFVSESGTAPDVIKIDVEGAELLVLRGAERVLSRYRPQLILGIHSYWLPPSQTVGEIFELLARFGHEVKDEHIIPFDGGFLGDYFCTQR